MKAYVIAGIPGLEGADVTMSGNNVEVVLPRAKILDMIPTEVEFVGARKYQPRSNIDNLKNSAIEQAKGKSVASAIQDENILGTTELKASQQLEKQLKALGFTTITITFEDQRPPVEVNIDEDAISIEEYGSREVVVSRVEIPLNNCGGSSPAKVNKKRSETMERGVVECSVSSGKLALPPLVPVMEIGLERWYCGNNVQVQSDDGAFELEAAAGTNVVYTVVWKKSQNYGLIKLMKGDQIESRYYVVEHGLTGGVVGSRDIGCE